MYANLRTRKKTTEDVIRMMGAMKEEIKRLDVKSGNVDTRIAILSDDINAKFETLFKALNMHQVQSAPVTTPSPHMSRGKTMRPNSAAERLPSTKNMSIESFANFNKQTQEQAQAQGRQRLGSSDSKERPLSAEAVGRPQLQRMRTGSISSTGTSSRPVSAQRGRRGSGEGATLRGRRMSDGKEILRVGFF
jgi:uncharacterized protein YoxC